MDLPPRHQGAKKPWRLRVLVVQAFPVSDLTTKAPSHQNLGVSALIFAQIEGVSIF
jgi:hypothetical protein